MSVQVSTDELFEQVGRWGFAYLLTVSDDERPHLVALRPTVVASGADRSLRFDAGGRRACHNAAARPAVSAVFPPIEGPDGSDGMSLVVDGTAVVEGDHVDITPTGAVLHRPAP